MQNLQSCEKVIKLRFSETDYKVNEVQFVRILP